jgi:hypothetical protein
MTPIYRWMLAATLFGSGTLTGLALADNPEIPGKSPDGAAKITFENARVAVKEITLAPGASRASRMRETDELVLFYAESHYQAVTPEGKTEPRDRKPGTVVWHKKGEVAPTLVNRGTKPVHYYSISLK